MSIPYLLSTHSGDRLREALEAPDLRLSRRQGRLQLHSLLQSQGMFNQSLKA